MPARAAFLSVRLVNFTLLVFAAMLLMLTACGRRDEPRPVAGQSTNKPLVSAGGSTNRLLPGADKSTLDPRLQGPWTWDEKDSGSGSLTFAPDGSYATRSTNRVGTGSKVVANEGRWGVKDGVLVFTYTRSTDPKVASGRRVDRYRVVRVDDKELALSDLVQSETNVFHRRK